MMFLYAEVLMHWLAFPVRLKAFYNAGMATSVGCSVIACCYFFGGVFDASMFFWYGYLLAVVWSIVNFVFFFRSKIYWGLGKKPGYALTEQSAFGVGFKK